MTELTQINHSTEYTGRGVELGNIDGWPALDHPGLQGRVSVKNLAGNTSFAPFSWNADHATAAAGIVVSVAKDANLSVTPVWTPGDQAVYYSLYATYFLNKCYAYFADKGVKCVNRELATPRSPWGYEAIWGKGELDLVARYPQYVHVQAAGNQTKALASQPFEQPASALEHLLIVGGVDGNNNPYFATNTPQSRGLYSRYDTVIKPEKLLRNFFVCAPATNIYAPASPEGHSNVWGTSFAAPYVQGLVGLMYEKAMKKNIVLSPRDCTKIIKETCRKLGPIETFGHGLIDCKAALERV